MHFHFDVSSGGDLGSNTADGVLAGGGGTSRSRVGVRVVGGSFHNHLWLHDDGLHGGVVRGV